MRSKLVKITEHEPEIFWVGQSNDVNGSTEPYDFVREFDPGSG